jgi:FAD/FMN-containing dehydrogenase
MTNPSDNTTVHTLRDRLQGELLLPGDTGYDEARAVWNRRFDPRPLAVARVRSSDDVAAVVNFARERRLPLSIRSGGHSYAGHAVGDGALALDLSPLNDVRIDAERRRALVGPGATWSELDGAAQAFGLATTGCTVSMVGVAGYVLGGGTGYLARRCGLAVDNLLAAEIVTADGRVLRASAAENDDLFWAIRGGSGNFGVVTSFELRLHPVGPEVVGAQVFHPWENAGDVLRFHRDLMATAPDEVNVYAFALRVPPTEPFPVEQHGRVALALIASHCGDVAAGEAALRRIAEHGTPFLAAIQSMPYATLQQGFDASLTAGPRWYTRAHFLAELSDAAIETFVQHAAELPGQFTTTYFEPMGGAINRVDAGATAFPHREAACALHIFPGWTDPADDENMMRWTRAFHDAMAPYANGGVYVNLLGRDEERRVPDAYGPNYKRLAQLKAQWDPENVFRINHNIRPAQPR